MRLPVLLVAALLVPLVASPAAATGEVVTEEYTGAGGASVDDRSMGVVLLPNDPHAPWTQAGVHPIGGVRLYASQAYNNVIITATDALFGSSVGISACFWNPVGSTPGNCEYEPGGEDFGTSAQCGVSVDLRGSPFAGSFVTVWVYLIHVDTTTTNICSGSQGTVSGVFF